MEFIKKMKKREYIEMSLKALAAILAAFLAIILMECMIYGVELNNLKTKGTKPVTNSQQTIAYCIKEGEDKYFVAYYNEGLEIEWFAKVGEYRTRKQCESLRPYVKDVVYDAPSAFKFSITPTHYIVMSVFVLGVAGFFVYKFIALGKEYKKIEEQFEKTGTIEISNM